MVCVGHDSTAVKCLVQDLSWSNSVCLTRLYSGEMLCIGLSWSNGVCRIGLYSSEVLCSGPVLV
jgi:hypothetical protein